MTLSHHHSEIINTLTIVLSAISLLGSGAIILSFIIFPKLRTFALQLVVWLSFSDFCANVADLIGMPEDGTPACTVQAVGKQFFLLAEVAWTTVISYTLYKTIVHQEKGQNRRVWRFHLYAWGLPFLFTLIPGTTGTYGESGPWCWITETDIREFDLGTAYRFLLFYTPLWAAIVFNSFIYFQVIRAVRRTTRAAGGSRTAAGRRLVKLCDRLRRYPLIMIICWTPATINRIQNAAAPTNKSFFLFFLHATFISLQGLFNAIAYGMNPQVIIAWRQGWAKTFNICARVIGFQAPPQVGGRSGEVSNDSDGMEFDDSEAGDGEASFHEAAAKSPSNPFPVGPVAGNGGDDDSTRASSSAALEARRMTMKDEMVEVELAEVDLA
mmetsp:Transcript_47727/g.82110  ORF Transcript_47727/g.82110 Transcript_47727/m.82110 type:complete len:382 (+) Transcript_47727:35-1180(+)